jgi:hypothetical protein
VNFLLYCLNGTKFRSEAANIICFCRQGKCKQKTGRQLQSNTLTPNVFTVQTDHIV